ncbi:hypothetical protein C8R47DRAFT_1071695 [Mycena vitilis]|nr:hypothetical protein C8R47DRAFT_1071695 [Mycena vitilis]
MSPNLCREMVLYVPLWMGSGIKSSPVLDEDGDGIPELIPENAFAYQIYMWIDASYTLPHNRLPRVDWTSAQSMEHQNYMTWFVPGTSLLQYGEQYNNMGFIFGASVDGAASAPAVHATYDTVCPHACKCQCHKVLRAKL